MEMKVNFLHDQGTADASEDGLIFYPPRLFGVTDGVSGVYLPEEDPKLFDGKTGGQLTSQTICAFVFDMFDKDLATPLKHANIKLSEYIIANHVNVEDSAFAPGACFVVARIDNEEIEIIQGGDCMAVWEYRNGEVMGIAHQNYQYEQFLLDTIEELMKKHNGDKSKMWAEFRPILIEKRRAYYNKPDGICILNGQPTFAEFWQQGMIGRISLKTLLLFSDGFVDFLWTESADGLATRVMDYYRQGGLQSVLSETREWADQKISKTHEDYQEATAIAIEF